MANYVTDPNNDKKVTLGPPGDTAGNRMHTPICCRLTKAPDSVLITKTITKTTIGFLFDTSASFASKVKTEGGGGTINLTIGSASLTGSDHYQTFGNLTLGSHLPISPTAFSASNDDSGSVVFVYSGINGSRRF